MTEARSEARLKFNSLTEATPAANEKAEADATTFSEWGAISDKLGQLTNNGFEK